MQFNLCTTACDKTYNTKPELEKQTNSDIIKLF